MSLAISDLTCPEQKPTPPQVFCNTSLVHQGWWKQHLPTWSGRKWESPLPPLPCSCDYPGAAGSVSGSALFSPVFCYQPGASLHRCSSRLLKNLSTVPQTWILPLWQSISHIAINTNQIMAVPSLDLAMAPLCLTINENTFAIVCKTPPCLSQVLSFRSPSHMTFFLFVQETHAHQSSLFPLHTFSPMSVPTPLYVIRFPGKMSTLWSNILQMLYVKDFTTPNIPSHHQVLFTL